LALSDKARVKFEEDKKKAVEDMETFKNRNIFLETENKALEDAKKEV